MKICNMKTFCLQWQETNVVRMFQSNKWNKWKESAPKKTKIVPSANKFMASVFFECAFVDFQ